MKIFLIVCLLSFMTQTAFASYAKEVCDDYGCRTKCDSHDGCSAPNGCYEAASEDMEGSNWWTNIWRKTLGKHCSVNANCESGNCGHDICDNSDKDGNCVKTHNECVPMKICRLAQFNETLVDGNRKCDEGLVPDMNNVCIMADVLEEDQNTATEVTINQTSCAMTVPSSYNTSFRYNNYLTQLLEYAFDNIEFGNDADCIGISKGVRHIATYLKAARTEYGNTILQGIKDQETAFYEHIQNNVDMTKKDSVDMYMESLNAIKQNHENYKVANEKLRVAFDNAAQDMVNLSDYYYGFNFSKDAVGNNSANRDQATTLSNGFRVAIRDSGKDYCRGRSPFIRNSWKRRYDIQDGVGDGLASYLHLPYNNFGKSVRRNFYMLDTPLPMIPGKSEMFKHFASSNSDGGVRANIRWKNDPETYNTAGYITYMNNAYGVEIYRKFMSEPTLTGGMTANSKKVIEEFSGRLGADKEQRLRKYMEPVDQYADLTDLDATTKYFVDRDAEHGNRYRLNMSLYNYLIEVYNTAEKTLKLTLEPKEKKQLMAFHKLMWDFRQRFFLVQFLYSASESRRHPVLQRGKFFNMFIRVFNANAKYLTMLNDKGHSEALACLGKLSIKYQEAVKAEDMTISGPTDYTGKKKDKKVLEGKLTKYDTKCTGKNCDSTLGSANLNIPSSGANGSRDGVAGTGIGGNFDSGRVASGSVGQAAIANYRKKKEEEFAKKATPAMKAAREANFKFLKMALSPPAAMGGGESAPISNSSSGGGSSPISSTEKEPAPTTVAVNAPAASGAPASPMSNISLEESKDLGTANSEITPEHAEALLSEVKDDKYKSDDNDDLFVKITKTYLRAGLPRLLHKKTELLTEPTEAFDPGVKKKKAE